MSHHKIYIHSLYILSFPVVQVFDFFQKRIEEQYPLLEANLDPYQQTKEAHEVSLTSKLPCIVSLINLE